MMELQKASAAVMGTVSNNPVKETELSRQLSNLIKNVECLEDVCRAIDGRLTGFCRPATLMDCESPKNPAISTQLSKDLMGISDKIGSSYRYLQGIISRLEI